MGRSDDNTLKIFLMEVAKTPGGGSIEISEGEGSVDFPGGWRNCKK